MISDYREDAEWFFISPGGVSEIYPKKSSDELGLYFPEVDGKDQEHSTDFDTCFWQRPIPSGFFDLCVGCKFY